MLFGVLVVCHIVCRFRFSRYAYQPRIHDISLCVYSSPCVAVVCVFVQGVRWADQQVSKQENKVLDALACPNLEAFLDDVTNQRKRTGAVEWSAEGERRREPEEWGRRYSVVVLTCHFCANKQEGLL